MLPETREVLPLVAQAIFDKKGMNILVLDAHSCATLADYYVIAEGRSDRHLQALCDATVEVMEQKGLKPLAIEGKRHGDWIAMDFGDLIVHLFGPGWRELYALEELWRDSSIIDIPYQLREGMQENAWSGED